MGKIEILQEKIIELENEVEILEEKLTDSESNVDELEEGKAGLRNNVLDLEAKITELEYELESFSLPSELQNDQMKIESLSEFWSDITLSDISTLKFKIENRNKKKFSGK